MYGRIGMAWEGEQGGGRNIVGISGDTTEETPVDNEAKGANPLRLKNARQRQEKQLIKPYLGCLQKTRPRERRRK